MTNKDIVKSDITIRDLIREATDILDRAGVNSPEFDAKVLMSSVSNMPLSTLPLHYGDKLLGLKALPFMNEDHYDFSENLTQGYKKLIERRASGEPLQYITGEQEFMGEKFFVDERVLIPRLDTEILAEKAIEIAKDALGIAGNATRDEAGRTKQPEWGTYSILDLCCGSGAIGLSIVNALREVKTDVELTLSDVSSDAIAVAIKNADALGFDVAGSGVIMNSSCGGTRSESGFGKRSGAAESEYTVRIVKSDVFDALRVERFDMIVTNPPYIPTSVIGTLEREVRDHEPKVALDGGEDGLDFYKRIAREAPTHLSRGGVLIMEIGADQADSVKSLLDEENKYDKITKLKDLAGLDRVVVARAL